MLPMESIKKLANADRHGVIKEIQEFYIDYYAINNDTWTLNIPNCLSTKADSWPTNLNRIVDGLAAQCLSLKMHPYVRYQKNSSLAHQVAQGLRVRSAAFLLHEKPLLIIPNRVESTHKRRPESGSSTDPNPPSSSSSTATTMPLLPSLLPGHTKRSCITLLVSRTTESTWPTSQAFMRI
jgi:hypothetical protein